MHYCYAHKASISDLNASSADFNLCEPLKLPCMDTLYHWPDRLKSAMSETL